MKGSFNVDLQDAVESVPLGISLFFALDSKTRPREADVVAQHILGIFVLGRKGV